MNEDRIVFKVLVGVAVGITLLAVVLFIGGEASTAGWLMAPLVWVLLAAHKRWRLIRSQRLP